MARFRFRLERLLGLRRSREEVARQAAAAAAAEAAARRAGRDLALELVSQAAVGLARRPAVVPARELASASAYLARMRVRAEAAAAASVEAERNRCDRVAAAVAAWRSRRVLDQLRSRQIAAWLHVEASAEQKEVDDISAGSRWRST